MQDNTDGSTQEPLTCAGCGHPIQDGQPIIVFAARHSQTDESSGPRVSWRDRLSKARRFYEGVEQLLCSTPQSIRDLYSKNRENVNHLAEGATALLVLAGKRAIALRGVSGSRLVAGGAVAAVVVGIIMVGAFNGRRGPSRNNKGPLYFHADCEECGSNHNCYDAFAEEMSAYSEDGS